MASRRQRMAVNGLDWAAAGVVGLLVCSTLGVLALATQHAGWLYAGWIPWVALLAVRRRTVPRNARWVSIAVASAAVSWSLTLVGLFFCIREDMVGVGQGVLRDGIWVRAGLPWPGVVGSLSGSADDTLSLVGGVDAMIANFLGMMLVVTPMVMRISVERVTSAGGWLIAGCCMACMVGGWRLVALLD